jgi:hypothetical protein
MDDGGAGLCGRDGGCGNLFWRDGAMRTLRDLGVIPGNGAGDDDVVIYGNSPSMVSGAPKFILF